MAYRITEKDLKSAKDRLNELTDSPMKYFTRDKEDNFIINVDHYHIEMCYGGNQLCQTINDGGGTKTISRNGFDTKRGLYNEILAIIEGIKIAKELTS